MARVTADGEKHKIYKKTTKRGEGKVGHIMVNHPTKDKGKWDTIDLTKKAGAKTIKQGIAATKKWHKDNPDYMYKGNKKATGGAQQAAIAIAMKKAGKKPKAQAGMSVKSTTEKDSTANKNWWLSDSIPSGVSTKINSLIEKEKKNSSGSKKYYPWGNKVTPKTPKMKSGGSTPAWTRKEGKNPEGGLNAKGVASYRAANPGSKLKTAVTTKPSKLDPDSKSAKRRKSFCSRMSGMKKKLTSAKTANDPNSRINKSLRKWNC
jgi:hypothetical protein